MCTYIFDLYIDFGETLLYALLLCSLLVLCQILRQGLTRSSPSMRSRFPSLNYPSPKNYTPVIYTSFPTHFLLNSELIYYFLSLYHSNLILSSILSSSVPLYHYFDSNKSELLRPWTWPKEKTMTRRQVCQSPFCSVLFHANYFQSTYHNFNTYSYLRICL